jgi:hypothetical protein
MNVFWNILIKGTGDAEACFLFLSSEVEMVRCWGGGCERNERIVSATSPLIDVTAEAVQSPASFLTSNMDVLMLHVLHIIAEAKLTFGFMWRSSNLCYSFLYFLCQSLLSSFFSFLKYTPSSLCHEKDLARYLSRIRTSFYLQKTERSKERKVLIRRGL